MLSGDFTDLPKNPKYKRYQNGLASMVYMFFDKKASDANIPDGVITSGDLEQISEIIVVG